MEQKQVRKNNIKKLLRWLLNIVLVFIIIPLVLTFMFRDPMVQSVSARMLTKWLSRETGYRIELRKVKLTVFEGFEFEGLKMDDHRGEVMLHIDRLSAEPMYSGWSTLLLRFNNLEIDGAYFRYAQYKEDNDFNLMIFLNKYLKRDTVSAPAKGRFHLNTKKLVLTNSRFHLYDEQQHYDNEKGVDYADMLIDSINLYGRSFHLVNDSLHLQIDSLFALEKSGFAIKRMSAEFGISSTNMMAHQLLLDSYNTHLDLDLDFNYASYQSYNHFIDSVEMKGDIRPSTIDMSVIGYFADEMFQMPDIVGVSGYVSGPVSSMKGDQLRVKYGRNTRLHMNAVVRGLPDFFTSYMEADIFELTTTPCDLKSFSLPDEEYKHMDLTDLVSCDESFSAKGTFRGYYEDFNAVLNLRANEGELNTDITYKKNNDQQVMARAHLSSDQFDVGNLLDIGDYVGVVTMDMDVLANGKTFRDIRIDADGFFSSAAILGYPCKRLSVKGWYKEDSINGTLRVGDKNLMMGGSFALKLQNEPLLAAGFDIKYANLKKLHLLKSRDFGISTAASLAMKGFNPDSLTGILTLENSRLFFGESQYPMQHAVLSKSRNGEDLIVIHSDYLDAEMKGRYRISEFGTRLAGLFDHYYHNGYDHSIDSNSQTNQRASIDVNIHDGILIEEQFVPGLYLSPETTLSAQFDFQENSLKAGFYSGLIEYEGESFNENQLVAETYDDTLFIRYNIDRIVLKDSTSDDQTVFGIDHLNMNSKAGNDYFSFGLYWDNKDSLLQNSAVVEGSMAYNNGASVLQIQKSKVYINDTLWQVAKGNSIVIDSAATHFNDVVIHGGKSRMSLKGEWPDSEGDTLHIAFNEWSLSHFDMLTKLYGFDLNGKINGNLEMTMPFDNLTFESDMHIDNLYFNNQFLGNASLRSEWNSASKSVFINSDIIREGSSGQGRVLSAIGFYYPFREKDNFDLKIDFNRLKIKAIEPFFIDYISNIEGVASGNFRLTGSPEEPLLVGMVDMKRAALVVNYLNTKYSFSNAIIFEPGGINFNNLVIYDTLGNRANISGLFKHQYFKDGEFDVHLTTEELLFFNTTKRMNDLYYGTAITSGDLKLTGGINDLKLKMDVSTLNGTRVNLPLDYSVEISDKDYIVFVDHLADTTMQIEMEEETPLDEDTESDKLKYAIDLQMNINPAAAITIFVPNDLGKIESRGRGDLKMNFNDAGDFKISGEYTVENGLFNLRIANLVNKRFELVKGGRISWSGDPYLANLNLKGIYRVKTNISSLGIQIDSTSDYKNKVVVECYVVLTNQLNNPHMRFELKLPDLDPDLKRAVYAEIDTTNPAMLNQQVMSLLVLGTFSASNASNISLSSSYYTVISNQLSKMLSRISDDFDIGINYKPGDQISQEEFEFALSTQLFDDRLSVEGNVGMTYDKVERNASNIVGDVDVSYKLTEDGRWILMAYNHSNVNSWYNYSNYDKLSPYTQGVGIGYTKDFDKLNELFKRTRPKKEKTEKRNAESIKNKEDETEE